MNIIHENITRFREIIRCVVSHFQQVILCDDSDFLVIACIQDDKLLRFNVSVCGAFFISLNSYNSVEVIADVSNVLIKI
jgi:hypothetical protein